ncbi:methyl-accepting chemotaxis protein [Alteromonas gilva]|uniref:Methyl-accepting chemotaxis protein n=1 Tax=Alteromonas gilva TaxID=2987522 RepID=A0ABT5L176_9ALTE|nr:methyl-accepting chemotaxis protein [Alteromonas gilva]MDC8830795.1 methyl-accepting chemotaxis protein [Alteromonas gilva]
MMQWFLRSYDAIEKTFFYTLTRKIVGNITFLFLFQLANFYLFYALLNTPQDAQAPMQTTLLVLFVLSTLSFAFTVFYLHHLIVKPVKALLDTLNDINHTQGDLSTRLPAFTHDEFSELSRAYNKFAHNLSGLIEQVYQHAEQASDANKQVTSLVKSVDEQAATQKHLSDDISSSSQQVSVSIHDIVSASEQVSTTNAQNQNNAESANHTLVAAKQQINKITELLNQFSATVQGLQNNADNVRNILKMVEGFADQTNLLALNAAIEAARAGEAGRGFAVVADEVRSLSAKVADATQQISSFLNEMETLVGETQQESTRLIDASSQMQQSIGDTSSTFQQMMEDFKHNIHAFQLILDSVNVLESQQARAVEIAGQITDLSDTIQHAMASGVAQADHAQSLASSTRKGLSQFVVR